MKEKSEPQAHIPNTSDWIVDWEQYSTPQRRGSTLYNWKVKALDYKLIRSYMYVS